MKHIVALSGGKDSTAMAIRLAQVEPRDYEYVCTPTGNELPEMKMHWRALEGILGQPMIRLGDQTLGGLVRLQNALPNWRMRWCTRMLKIEPFEEYILENRPCTLYVGLRADEPDREGVDYALHEGVTNRFVLREWGWDKVAVIDFLQDEGITIPFRTDCGLCFFQTIWEWYQLWLNHPGAWGEGLSWEAMTGHTLRSPGRDSWPASLKELGEAFAGGRIPKQGKGMEGRTAMCSVCAR